MPFFSGEHGGCAWSLTLGPVVAGDLDQFVAYIARFGRAIRPGYVVLDLVHSIAMPSSLERQRITDALAATPNKELLAGHALVTNSSAARGVLTAINWFVDRPFPERVFAQPAEAARWLATLSPALDSAELLRAVARESPLRGLRW